MENWYKNYKFAGYVKPPEDIVNYIMDIITPYANTAWVNTKVKINNIEILNMKKVLIKWQDIAISDAQKNGLNILRKRISDLQNDNEELLKTVTVNIGGINNIIKEFEIPNDMTNEAIEWEYSSDWYPELYVAVKFKEMNGGTFQNTGERCIISIGIYQHLINRNVPKWMELKGLYPISDYIESIKKTVEHEVIHFLQEWKGDGKYGMPKKEMRDNNSNLNIYHNLSDEKKKKLHPMLDDEFFTRLHDTVSKLKSVLIKNRFLEFSDFIESDYFLNSLRGNNTGKYRRAVSELYKVFEQLKNNRKA